MDKQKTRVLINNTLMMYVLSIAKLIIPLISLPYLTRVLTVDTYGAVSFVKNLIGYMQILVDFGFLLSATKDLINIMRKKEPIKTAIGDTLYAQSILCVIAVAIMIICSFSFDILNGYELFSIISILPVIVSIFLFEYVFKAYEQMGKIAIKYIAMRTISLILTLIFVKGNSDIYLIPLFDTIASLIAVIMVYFQLKKLNISISFNIVRIKQALSNLKKSFVYFLSSFSTTAFSLLNTLIIGILLTKEDVAYWNIAMQLVTAVQALYAPIINSVFPTMVKERSLRLIHKILLIYMPLIFVGCGCILLLGDWLVTLVFTKQYIISSKILKNLIPVLILCFPSQLYGWPCLGAIDKQKQATASTVISAVIQTLGLVILIIANQFTLLNVCLVRNVTELSLAGIRMGLVYKNKNMFADKNRITIEGELMDNRNEELLNKIHEKQLDLLEKFDELCNKLNLKYSISSGTLLGAVRHKGFIPWDDDVDVVMPREDYEILIKEANKNLPEGYFLQHFTTDKYAVNMFAKIRNSNTTWITDADTLKKEHNMGFGMDVFPVDKIADRDQQKKLRKKNKKYIALRRSYNWNTQHSSLFKKIVSKFILFPIARVVGLYMVNKNEDKLHRKFSKGDYTYADSFMGNCNKFMPYSIFEEYTTIEFEGKQFRCVKEYEQYLIAMYGDDYMQLPPVEKRHTHLAKVIDCEKPYIKYIKNK